MSEDVGTMDPYHEHKCQHCDELFVCYTLSCSPDADGPHDCLVCRGATAINATMRQYYNEVRQLQGELKIRNVNVLYHADASLGHLKRIMVLTTVAARLAEVLTSMPSPGRTSMKWFRERDAALAEHDKLKQTKEKTCTVTPESPTT